MLILDLVLHLKFIQQGTLIINLPKSLVKTWLELSSTKTPETPEEIKAHLRATKNIMRYFGNMDLAEDYIYSVNVNKSQH